MDITIDHARKRIAAIRAEIERLKQSEFPYTHPRDALDLLEKMFMHQQTVLEKVSPTAPANVILNACSTSVYQLFIYVPILGFILRSTNVRNAFEAYAPLLRLTRSILGSNTKLIISSEWAYSPHVYQSITELPGFVLIGLPAPESANPLLIPLAGHELGHAMWKSEGLATKFGKQIEDAILKEITEKRWKEYEDAFPQVKKEHYLANDILARPIWLTSYTWALRQVEEIFCDFFGIRLFSEAYLSAFEYLIAPGFPGERTALYPNIERRISHLMAAAKELSVAVEPGFASRFKAEDEPRETTTKLLVSTADAVSAALVPALIKEIVDIAACKKIPQRDAGKVEEIGAGFSKIIPTAKAFCITDIVNAGWICYLNADLWTKFQQIKEENRGRVLKDLMLKSLEVSETYERLREPQ
jgi:hypothetical protein